LLAQRDERAVGLLERLRDAAEAGGRTGTVIAVLVLLALARDADGDRAAAVDAVRRAVALAGPEGYVRVFADEGPPMATLLREAGEDQAYVRRLRAAAAGRTARPPSSGLIEPLSARELDVLRLLASDLDGPDIARQLSVSLNTLRTHTRNIFRKLEVTSRRAAVRRAAELELLPGNPSRSGTRRG
jgi:LuxR family maltose regulon positive regulatory protein